MISGSQDIIVGKSKGDFVLEEGPAETVGATIHSCWDPATVWDGVRNARSNVDILQTWFPGGESEVARFGVCRTSVNYRFLLLHPDSKFVDLRIKGRFDFAWTFGGLNEKRNKVCERVDRSIKWLCKKGYSSSFKVFDGFIPGPAYFIDDLVYYGCFLPHKDAAVGPLHCVPRSSSVGKMWQDLMEFTWSKLHVDYEPKLKGLMNDLPSEFVERIEQLELDVAWLQYPLNQEGGLKSSLVQGTHIYSGISEDFLIDRIKSAKVSIKLFIPWAMNPDKIFSEMNSLDIEYQILLPTRSSEFIDRRSQVIQGDIAIESLMDNTEKAVLSNPLITSRFISDLFFPGCLILIDEAVYYSVFLMNKDPFKDPIHCVSLETDIGEVFEESFNLGWGKSRSFS